MDYGTGLLVVNLNIVIDRDPPRNTAFAQHDAMPPVYSLTGHAVKSSMFLEQIFQGASSTAYRGGPVI